MKNLILVSAIVLTSLFNVSAQDISTFFSDADVFFKTYVNDGRVDYKALKNDSSKLDMLITMAQGISVSKDNAKDYQAFWINGYNLHVIKGIVNKYPLKSPLDIPGFFDKTKRNIGGKEITLNDIENKLLRGNFPSEPRFHFVLVCAGLGCPPIITEAYTPSQLNDQLERQTKKALNDPNFIRVNKNKVKVSQIFEWYKGDFTQNGKSLVDFINGYKMEQLPEKAKVSYYPYDWTLNAIQ
ncbi:MAG: DUF547 domain-containing protein [Bacteroidota bacterium]